MDLQSWKEAVRHQVQQSAKTIRQLAPDAVYGFLAASTLMPLISAVGQGNSEAVKTLSNLVSGAGSFLIAYHLQAWKDRTAADLAPELAAAAIDDENFREALDQLLKEFQTPSLARQELSGLDKDWFVAELRAEMEILGSPLTINYDGVLVQGERNIAVGNDAENNTLITGDGNIANNNVIVLSEQFAADFLRQLPLPAARIADLQRVTERYSEYLITRYQFLDFRGMGMADRVALKLPLAEMYVPLRARVEMPEGETWARHVQIAGRRLSEGEAHELGERLSEPQPLLDLLQECDGLIILGDPGAGKTTFLKYLALHLAEGRGDAVGMGNRLPIVVPLSAYANALAEADVALSTFLAQYYQKQGVDLPLDDLLNTALDEGRALLLLDGLDEVQVLNQRHLVMDRVMSFYASYRTRGNKFVLTSRVVGYREVRPVADGLMECTIADLDGEEIAQFVEKWTAAIERAAHGETQSAAHDAAVERDELLYAVQHSTGVRQLAANPLLLTILALMKRQGVALPERRAELYHKYVETLLRHWNLARGLDRRSGRELDVVETLRVLAPLGLWMHQTSPGVGLVKREETRRRLEDIYTARQHPEPERAATQLLADARDHASLLLERGPGEYGFIHLTFQEYLAAVAIAQQGQRDVAPVVELLAAHVEDDTWHEVTLLTVGYMGLVQQLDEVASDVIEGLLTAAPGDPGAAVVLAGEAVADALPSGVTAACQQRVREALMATMVDPAVAPRVRAEAGSVLGALGDPRDMDEMVAVPAGTFIMGTTDAQGEEAVAEQLSVSELDSFYTRERMEGWIEDEKPHNEVHVADFRIGKYPITNSQYAEFVAATEYEPPQHWTGRVPPLRLRSHPVVNVTWHDAMAYCQWLSEMRSEPVRLPTEAEWEKAARGTDGRFYPWHNEFDPLFCNMAETGIGRINTVGIFPGDESPYGCREMAGNVLEWTQTLWGGDAEKEVFGYPYDVEDGRESLDAPKNARRVVRGGAFVNNRLVVRCAYRARDDADNRDSALGFRVVSPGLCNSDR